MLVFSIALIIGSCFLGGARSALLPTDLKVPQPSVCGLQKLFCYHTGIMARNDTRMEAAIDYACSQWDGHQLPKSDGKEGIDEYYSPNTDELTVSMNVRKTGKYNSLCGYKIVKETCKYWLSKPFEYCPSQQGGNATDLWCGLEWTIDPDGRALEKLGKGTVQKINCSDSQTTTGSNVNLIASTPDSATSGSSVSLDTSTPDGATSGSSITFYNSAVLEKSANVPAADPNAFSLLDFDHTQCYGSGHTWSSNWMVKGADKFCYWASNTQVEGGGYLNYTHHVCANGQDFRQWFSFENPSFEPYTLSYAACRSYTQPFIDSCNKANDQSSVKQGGWGIGSAGMGGYVVVDGDPDMHNPGKAEPAVNDCTNEGWVRAQANFYASDQVSDAGMKFAAYGMKK